MNINKLTPRIAVAGLAHPFEEGYADAPRLVRDTVAALEAAGAACVDTGVVMEDLTTVGKAAEALRGQEYDSLLVCVATWSEDHHLFDLLADVHAPLLLRAYPAFSTGSLCCVHQICCVLTELGTPYTYIYGDPDDRAAADEAVSAAAVHAVSAALRRLRVGSIGGRAKGMTEIACDEFGLMDKLGVRVAGIDESELLAAVAAVSDGEADTAWRELKLQMELRLEKRGCKVLSAAADVREAVKYYLALKALVKQYGLGALAVKCYTAYMGKVCLGYSLLAEEGIACSCEGDVPNAVTMTLLQLLSGRPVNNTDLLYPDPAANTILFAHCGSSGLSIAGGPVELAPVRLADTGVCVRFLPQTGPVTLVNLCGHGDKLRMTVMAGEAVPTGMEFAGNPAKVRFDRPVLDICKNIASQGAGHHWMIAYGDCTEMLEWVCEDRGLCFSWL